jgi:hypothetical protein
MQSWTATTYGGRDEMLRFIFKQTNCDDNRADKYEAHYTIDIDSPVLQAALTSGGNGPMGFERHELIGVEVLPSNTQANRTNP